jgi:hypothetical protein
MRKIPECLLAGLAACDRFVDLFRTTIWEVHP